MDKKQLIDQFVEKVSSGAMPFSQVRETLQKQGMDEAEIKTIVMTVDAEVQRRMLAGQSGGILANIIGLGVASISIGVVVLVIFLLTGTPMMGRHVIFFGYGPFMLGIALLLAGLRRKMRKKTSLPGDDFMVRRDKIA